MSDATDEQVDAALPKEAWPAVQSSFAAVGLPLDPPRVRAFFKEIPYGGQTIAVRVPDDVRLTVNPSSGARLFGTLLHEAGHAVQAARTLPTTPAILKGYEWLLGATASGFDEGTGQLFGQSLLDEAWLHRFAGLDTPRVTALIARERLRFLMGIRSLLLSVALERRLYAEGPERGDEIERELIRKYLGVEPGPESAWAATITLVSYPLYQQSYLIADMEAAQVRRALKARFGLRRLDDPQVGAFLTDTLFADGERRPFNDRVRAASGATLSPEALLLELGL
jgi:hypothetical protein